MATGGPHAVGMTTNTAIRPPIIRPDGIAAGRWTVDAARSRLLLDARVCGVVEVRGRFTELAGELDATADPPGARLGIDVVAGSLTSGNDRIDALLAASGLIDPDAGELIRYRSASLHPTAAPVSVAGVLGTARGRRPLVLRLASPPTASGTHIRLHVRGVITRDDIGHLLARPGAARLIGPTAGLDLRVELSRS